jgi:hypothetical protein
MGRLCRPLTQTPRDGWLHRVDVGRPHQNRFHRVVGRQKGTLGGHDGERHSLMKNKESIFSCDILAFVQYHS